MRFVSIEQNQHISRPSTIDMKLSSDLILLKSKITHQTRLQFCYLKYLKVISTTIRQLYETLHNDYLHVSKICDNSGLMFKSLTRNMKIPNTQDIEPVPQSNIYHSIQAPRSVVIICSSATIYRVIWGIRERESSRNSLRRLACKTNFRGNLDMTV